MSRRSRIAAASTLGLLGLTVAGCYGNTGTEFPVDFEPWEEQMSAPAPATPDDPCPETLVLVESRGYVPESGPAASSVHGTGCIHEPLATVWASIQSPETGRDPSVNAWTLFPEPQAECENGLFETAINAGPAGFTVDFRICWRFAVVEGTDAAPIQVVSRWSKVYGTTAIRVLEGSLVARQFEGDPNITVVDYQYHLNAASTGPSNYQTINEYLSTIYSRLVRHSHGETL